MTRPMMNEFTDVPGSFRDPSGSVKTRNGLVYRQVNQLYRVHYDHLVRSGLYDGLVQNGLLVAHREVEMPQDHGESVYRMILPDQIPFISYPYEWSFSQLKHAALLTLEIQSQALDSGMSLKDCSAYNVQFLNGHPIFIDTLSFEKYQEGLPWVAYRQFCQHFLAPLALMSHVDIRQRRLLQVYLDGIPLDLASGMLPTWTQLKFGLLLHIHLHARAQTRYSGRRSSIKRQRTMSKTSFRGLVDSLKNTVRRLRWQSARTTWQCYYSMPIYSPRALAHKKRLVGEMLDAIDPRPAKVWDLGANTGLFSRLASDRGMQVISFDLDAGAVEQNYLTTVTRGDANILPLVMDLANPSPDLGWAGRERMSLLSRGPADTVLALALVHHLAMQQSVPLGRIAALLDLCCESLIIEFVPKTDPQVQTLLDSREDIFGGYDSLGFELEFSKAFSTVRKERIVESDRVLYLMVKRKPTLVDLSGRRSAPTK